MSLTYRAATPADFEQIIALITEFSVFEKTPEKMKNSVERMQAEQDFFNCIIVENEAGTIVAYVAYFYCYFTWSGKSLFMDDLYVTPAYRGKGIGGQLIERLIELARSEGCHRLHWQVSEWNAKAITFYEKLGAKIEHTEKNCDLYLD